MNEIDSPLAIALRDFGDATERLLTAWLESLPPENVRTLDIAVSNGAQVGVKVMIAAPGKAPTLEFLVTLPNGTCAVVGTIAHEIGTLQ